MLFALAACGLGSATDAAADPGGEGARFEMSVGFQSWPDIEDLQPLARGRLDKLRFSVRWALHWPVKQSGDRELLVGFELGLIPNTRTPLASGGFLVPSARWRPGQDRRWSVDAGLGFYKANFAEIAGRKPLLGGTDIWNGTGFGGFFGGTWTSASAMGGADGGVTGSFEVHFVDLGTVDGEALVPPQSLGDAAAKLNRGFYQMHLGYQRD